MGFLYAVNRKKVFSLKKTFRGSISGNQIADVYPIYPIYPYLHEPVSVGLCPALSDF